MLELIGIGTQLALKYGWPKTSCALVIVAKVGKVRRKAEWAGVGLGGGRGGGGGCGGE